MTREGHCLICRSVIRPRGFCLDQYMVDATAHVRLQHQEIISSKGCERSSYTNERVTTSAAHCDGAGTAQCCFRDSRVLCLEGRAYSCRSLRPCRSPTITPVSPSLRVSSSRSIRICIGAHCNLPALFSITSLGPSTALLSFSDLGLPTFLRVRHYFGRIVFGLDREAGLLSRSPVSVRPTTVCWCSWSVSRKSDLAVGRRMHPLMYTQR